MKRTTLINIETNGEKWGIGLSVPVTEDTLDFWVNKCKTLLRTIIDEEKL